MLWQRFGGCWCALAVGLWEAQVGRYGRQPLWVGDAVVVRGAVWPIGCGCSRRAGVGAQVVVVGVVGGFVL